MLRSIYLRRSGIALTALLALTCLATAPALADSAMVTSPFLSDLDRLEEKVVGLAEAIPADQYGWSPAEGVRSVSQVFMHMAGAMHFFGSKLGGPAPEGNLEEITDKDAVVAELKKAFAGARETVGALTHEDLEAELDLFGGTWTKAQVVYLIGTHNHEHLGQSIAYARSIGVTPPWSQ
jgi:uncharacterized damage-inducible protein DinB